MSKYINATWGILITIILVGYPALLVKLNPPPIESELIHFHVKILSVSERSPNLVAITNDGENLSLRFPTPLYMLFNNKTAYPGLSSRQENNLPGCEAEVYGANVRYLWPPTFRVWKIECATAPVSYSQIVKTYVSMNSDYAMTSWFVIAVMSALIAGVLFQKERKKK
ncbi:hypothetical protein [Paraburkholderia bannensis]|uniref:hypothetical protein n=1 Tax=Paraburkholderia bannensis TaxID=765414 RepID=UPI002AB7EA84|nr:hypothetical protein [Paraburkholderia bannensis]